MSVIARGTLHGQDIEAEAINPGAWFGKTWLVIIGGSYWPIFVCVEADTKADVIEELADNDKYRHHLVVEGDDLKDYDPDNCMYSGQGEVLDLDWIEHVMAWKCMYHCDDAPSEGVAPADYEEYFDWAADTE